MIVGIVVSVIALIVVIFLLCHIFFHKEYFTSRNTPDDASSKKQEPSKVVELMHENFEQYQKGTYIVIFLSDGCGWCQKFKTDTNNFREVADKYPGKILTVNLNTTNIQDVGKLLDKAEIEGIPAICIMNDGELTVHENVERTNDGLANLYSSQIKDSKK